MIIGRCARCWKRPSRNTWSTTRRRPIQLSLSRRHGYSTSTATPIPPAPQSPSSLSALASLKDELDRSSPRFDLQASQIEILQSPTEFYETLKAKILNARTRIYLTTLYIGKTEHELISTIRQALLKNPNLKVSFLTDALRGTRESPEPSCASLLAGLVVEFGDDRVEVRMYHTPNLTGIRKKIIPKRINEGWGLQHMKLYGIDDEVIISGANLSSDYFTNRQDRYHIIASQEMTDYFANIHDAVSRFSYIVQPDQDDTTAYHLHWPESNGAPSPLDNPSVFIDRAGATLNPLIKPQATQSTPKTKHDTTIYPLAQLTPLLRPDTSTEYPALLTLLRHLSTPHFSHSKWTFTAGYFNIRPELQSLLLSSNCRHGVVVTASPWANGFYGSKGISGLLPAAYSLLSRRFLESVHRAGKAGQHIEMKEWRHGTVGEPGGWTYHAKGLWVTLPGDEHPCMTLVGSSNYTKRSYALDLEMNVLIVTEDEGLKKRLGEEQDLLQREARRVELDDFMTPERRVGIHVRIAMWIVGLVGAAL
ncbi:MAG: CDP-diacylglycerol--glycerol-3-phosphate 3-phosphatidyltransferase [Peltula sp. TS41687]|nr:MAG: CDP-diacylglycerol--glycerol-3-phosphate 3-phosphatidyltransferase [Peltula sp. TS41687]